MKKFDDTFKRFDAILACDRQTDEQTDGHLATKHREVKTVIAVVTRLSEYIGNGIFIFTRWQHPAMGRG